MKRLVTLLFVFLLGAGVSGAAVWRLVYTDLWRTQELLSDGQYIAELDLQSRLLSLNDEDLRCTLAKLAQIDVKSYSEKDLGESPRFGPPGLADFVTDHRDKAIKRFEQLEIEEYAKECKPSEKLF